MKPLKRTLLLCLVLCIGSFSHVFAQQERITNYDVTIEIDKNRSITVTEEISVYANQNEIRRGITRSLPKTRNFQGKQRAMQYNILEIKRDGQSEDYHTDNSNVYKTLYIGNENVFLSPGNYTYTIKYRVPHQIALYEDFDELYWNAIGTDVKFSVEKASCTVILPEGVEMLQHACYTGAYGSTGDECSMAQLSEEEGIQFETFKPLQPYEGMTVGVGFEKGKMQPPSFLERFGIALWMGGGLLALLAYFFVTWSRHGVDPPKPTPFPVFESPGGRSPAELGYIWKERYSNKMMTASLINLAIKGYLRIDEEEKEGFLMNSKIYDLVKLKNATQDLPDEEKDLLNRLFQSSKRVEIGGKYNSTLEKAVAKHVSSLKSNYHSFITEGNNRKFLTIPILGALVFWGIGLGLFMINGGDMSAEGVLTQMGPNLLALILFVPLAIIGMLVYTFLIKKPSTDKLALQSAIEGFQMYLEMAEEERVELNNPFDDPSHHFEEMLPYAIALGVENEWSKSFKKQLDAASYKPKWSNNPYFYHHAGYYHSFSRSMSMAATPPSSSGSGGSGGGGFSGGGGGGGGVGGW